MNNSHKRCGKTGKRIFKSQDAAFVFAAGRAVTDKTLDQYRAYKCVFCGGWHLTSQPSRT